MIENVENEDTELIKIRVEELEKLKEIIRIQNKTINRLLDEFILNKKINEKNVNKCSYYSPIELWYIMEIYYIDDGGMNNYDENLF